MQVHYTSFTTDMWVMCCDTSLATTSLGDRNFSAPLPPYGTTIAHAVSPLLTERLSMWRMTVVKCRESLETENMGEVKV